MEWGNTLLKRLAATTLGLLLVAGCASKSGLTDVWYDESFRNTQVMTDVLVTAIVKNQDARKRYEDRFVKVLNGAGVRARASHTLAQPDIKPERDAILAAIGEAGAKSVFITRHLNTETKQVYHQPKPTGVYEDTIQTNLYGAYGNIYREVYSPGYYTDETTVTLESRLYDVETEKLVWKGVSASVNPEVNKKFINGLVEIFVAEMLSKDLM
jgi:hypothetical protein